MLVSEGSGLAQGKKPASGKVKTARSTERSDKKLPPVPKRKKKGAKEKPPVVAEAPPEVSNDNVLETLPPSDAQEVVRLQRLGLYLKFARGRPLCRDDAERFWNLDKRSRGAVPAAERIRATAELLQRGLQTTSRDAIWKGILSTHHILTATFGHEFGFKSV